MASALLGNRKLSRRQDFVKGFLRGGVLQGGLALEGLCDLILGKLKNWWDCLWSDLGFFSL